MQAKILSASGVVTPANNAGMLYSAIITSGASAGTATFKDGGSGGTTIFELKIPANSTADFDFKKPVRFTGDIYLALTGVTYAYVVFETFKAG